jgi:hypothetical protein
LETQKLKFDLVLIYRTMRNQLLASQIISC